MLGCLNCANVLYLNIDLMVGLGTVLAACLCNQIVNGLCTLLLFCLSVQKKYFLSIEVVNIEMVV